MTNQFAPTTSGRSQLITYMGAGFALFGMFLFLVSATSPFGLGIFLSLGVIVFGMGLVLSYVGLKSDPEVDLSVQDDGADVGQPLSYLDSVLSQNRDVVGGNRAFAFVLTSLGIFVLTVSGIYGLFLGSWPLLLLGTAFFISGVILYSR